MKLAMLTLLLAATVPASPKPNPLQEGLTGAIEGCALWILEPATWTNGFEQFQLKVGLGQMMGKVDSINEWSQPPKNLRHSNHYWRINATPNAGYVLVVSDRLPMCHLTGGGQVDMRPAISATLSSTNFSERWEKVGSKSRGGLSSTEYRNRLEPRLSLVLSQPDERQWSIDKLQIIMTAQYRIGN